VWRSTKYAAHAVQHYAQKVFLKSCPCAARRRVVVVDVAARALSSAVAETPAEHGVDDMRFNDGKGAPGGELIIGRMHSKWRDGKPGRLYRCAPAPCYQRTTRRCRPSYQRDWGQRALPRPCEDEASGRADPGLGRGRHRGPASCDAVSCPNSA
jgi:hypothetical protein